MARAYGWVEARARRDGARWRCHRTRRRVACRGETAGPRAGALCTIIGSQLAAMFTRFFHADHFLRRVQGTEPFADFCRLRRIQTVPGRRGHMRRWADVLAGLPEEQRARVEL